MTVTWFIAFYVLFREDLPSTAGFHIWSEIKLTWPLFSLSFSGITYAINSSFLDSQVSSYKNKVNELSNSPALVSYHCAESFIR